MNIVFRTDSSIIMGSGHVMRCLTLAEELKNNGADIIFICRRHEGNLNKLISKKAFQVIELPEPETMGCSFNKKEGDNYISTRYQTKQNRIQEFTVDIWILQSSREEAI